MMWLLRPSHNTKYTSINPRPAGGGGGGAFERPPSGFSRIAKNGGAQRRQVFTHLTPIFSATFVKISTQCHVRSGHQVRSSDPTTK